eukprot:16665-Heterococcus_DN1.PRE.4
MMPFVRTPVKVNFFMSSVKRSASIALIVLRALLANWIGPPNRLNESVFSKTVTSKPLCFKYLAAMSPPTPPPLRMTRSGLASLISSGGTMPVGLRFAGGAADAIERVLRERPVCTAARCCKPGAAAKLCTEHVFVAHTTATTAAAAFI